MTIFALIVTLGVVARASLYTKISFEGDVWPKFVYHTSSIAKTLTECGAICKADGDNCNAFIYKNKECHLGDKNGANNLIPSTSISEIVYMDINLILQEYEDAKFMNISGFPYHQNWTQHIYKSVDVAASNIQKELQCWIKCYIIEANCDMFVVDSDKGSCFLGNSEYSSGPDPDPFNENVPSWTIFMTNDIWSNEIQLREFTYTKNINEIDWKGSIFWIKENITNETECHIMCGMLAANPCNFVVHYSQKCYFGGLFDLPKTIEVDETEDPTSISFHHTTVKFPDPIWVQHFAWRSGMSDISFYAYKKITIEPPRVYVDPTQSCGISCALDPQCHSAAHVGSTDCYFLNVNTEERFGTEPISSPDVHIVWDKSQTYPDFINKKYFMIYKESWVWRTMTRRYSGGRSLDECALACEMWEKYEPHYMWNRYACGFFVRQPSGYCFVGNFTDVPDTDGQYYITKEPIHIHRERVTWTVSKLFKSRTSTIWAKHMFKTIDLTSDVDDRNIECATHCMLDARYCFMYVVEGDKCHLGDPNVDTTIVSSSQQVEIFQRYPKAVVQFGGTSFNGWGWVKNNGWTVLTEGKRTCNNHGLGEPWDVTTIGRSLAYNENQRHLVLSGGYNPRYWESFGRRLGHPGKRNWIQANMPQTRGRFPFVQIPNTDNILAIGGMYEEGDSERAVFQYNTVSKSWSNHYDNLQNDVYKQCSTWVVDELWLIGGEDPIANVLVSEVWGYKLAPNTWTTKPSLPEKGFGSCTSYQSPLNDHWIIIFNLINNDVVYTFDVTENSGWRLSPGTVPYRKWRISAHEGIFVVNPFEIFIMSAALDGSKSYSNEIMIWDYVSLQFKEADPDILPNTQSRHTTSTTLVPLEQLWLCIPQSKAWIQWYHQTGSNRFSASDTNRGSENNGLFISHDRILEHRSCDGSFHFRLVYPKIGFFQEWIQTSDPFVGDCKTVPSGFKPIQLASTENFGGLRSCAGMIFDNRVCILHGDTRSETDWWYPVGVIDSYPTFPGIHVQEHMDRAGTHLAGFVDHVEAYIMKDC